MTLHGAIDDATGTVLALVFRPTEDLHGYATLLDQLGTAYGLPLALYGDRLNVFVRNDRHWSLEEQLQGEQHPTHFGLMLRRLGIGFIAAGSPQAKGRIERLWRTLQDRLTVELRLPGCRTLAEATAVLPTFRTDFNQRFAHPPVDATAAWRPAPRDLAAQLSCHYSRRVGQDNVVRLGARVFQLPRRPHGAPPPVIGSTSPSAWTDGSSSSSPTGPLLNSPRRGRNSPSSPSAPPGSDKAGAYAPPGAHPGRGVAISLSPRNRPRPPARGAPVARRARTRGVMRHHSAAARAANHSRLFRDDISIEQFP